MKNIEINIKEQDTYEALLPASISNVVYSSDTVNSMFNLSSGSMIDDAFSAISTNFDPLMANLGIVTVKLWDGTPVEGITLDGGIKDNNGNTPITDANGRAVVSTNTDEFTFSVASLWADISDVPSQSYPKTGAPTYINVTMADKGIRKLEVTSSQTIRFSSVVKQFDVFGVGGGGGGGMGVLGRNYPNTSHATDSIAWGFGGAGGYTQTTKSVNNTLEELVITIGRGGNGGGKSFGSSPDADEDVIYRAGDAGGSTTVSLGSNALISVSGGQGGTGRYESNNSSGVVIPEDSDYTPSNGGSGGGALRFRYGGTFTVNIPGGEDGGNGAGEGQGTTTREFGEDTGALYASGGGSALAYNAKSVSSNRYGGKANNGGTGAGAGFYTSEYIDEDVSPVRGNNGSVYGSGGGGLSGEKGDSGGSAYGGNGASGIVIFRWTI